MEIFARILVTNLGVVESHMVELLTKFDISVGKQLEQLREAQVSWFCDGIWGVAEKKPWELRG